MSNERYTQFLYTKHGKPVILDVDVPIGATGAVGTLAGGAGVSTVARNSAGIYQVNFTAPMNKFLGVSWNMWSPASGSDVLVASAGTVSGTTYSITTVGTTTTAGWQTLGLPVGVTPAVGVAFKATATTTAAGTGAVQIPAAAGSAITSIEVVGNPNLTMYPTGIGAALPYVIIRCLGATDASTTTFIAKDPAQGSTMSLEFYFADSSNVAKNNG